MTSTGREIGPLTSSSLIVGKAEGFGAAPFVAARRPNASLNDDLIDISYFQHFAAYCIKAGPLKRTTVKTLYVCALDMEGASAYRNAPCNINRSHRGDNPHDDFVVFRVLKDNLD
jgi:hypothetical protein